MSHPQGPEPRVRPLAPGDLAPSFALPAVASDGSVHDFSLAEALGRGPLLLVFYQDDGMPVCTSELKAFAQEYETIAAAGIGIVAINTNGIGSHQKFQERDHFPFPLISDFYGEAVKAFGLWDDDERKSNRALVLVGEDGRVRHVEPHFNPGNLNAFEAAFAAMGLA